jgi:hypothetical protein
MVMLNEGQWNFIFKNEVFIRSLEKLYPDSFRSMLKQFDGSSSANFEQLGFDKGIIGIADSLPAAFTRRPELNWKVEDIKIVMNLCIAYRNSPDLDHFTSRLYKTYYRVQ